tara:strand:+ start:403 stop:681 length:279 start_codon:yes stop_codon:yes gene_type:complete
MGKIKNKLKKIIKKNNELQYINLDDFKYLLQENGYLFAEYEKLIFNLENIDKAKPEPIFPIIDKKQDFENKYIRVAVKKGVPLEKGTLWLKV